MSLNFAARIFVGKLSFAGIAFLFALPLVAQTPPVITGPSGESSVAFWYLGGVTPSCCADITNKYWTIWSVNLTTNTSDPTPTITWGTDSPSKIQITANGTSGATLSSLGPSGAGTGFDINIWVTVDGVQSANFPVLISTPWTHSTASPTSVTCASILGTGYVGYVGQFANSATDVDGVQIIPIDVNEAWENDKPLYTGENWGSAANGSWPATDWSGNTYVDSYLLCYNPSIQTATPTPLSWNTSGTTTVNSDTQKYFFGSRTAFTGECTERKAVTWYRDHVAFSNITTPVTTQSSCASGSGFAN